MLSRMIGRSLLLGLVPLFVACGGGGDGGEGSENGGDNGGAQAAPVDLSNAGSITGTVTFTGSPAAPEPIDMSAEEQCASAHQTPPTTERAVVGTGGALANVFVYLKEGVPAGEWPRPDNAVVLDQEGCQYRPHVLGVQTGQNIEIRNSDGILHNINTTPEANRGFNISQPTTMTSNRSFTTPEVMIPVRCDVHGWMEAYIGVQSHPYFEVTEANGQFTLNNVPPGDYVIEAWHELYGVRTANVTVQAGAPATVDFTFDASTAGTAPLGEPLVVHHAGGHDVGEES